MGKIAFLFSGQGAQYTGMGQELYRSSEAARSVFELADKVRPATSAQCFTSPKEELSLTVNTQPCVYCVDLAAAEAIQANGIQPDVVAGFSLGEVAALTFTKVFTSEDGFSFVCNRGHYMNEAAEKTGGGMVAVLRLSNHQVEALCSRFSRIYPVNYNCPGQLAVAGDREELKQFAGMVAEKGGRAVSLAVSGAFHSPFMKEAAARVREDLTRIPLHPPAIPVYSDYSAEYYPPDPENIRNNLAFQVDHPVKWQMILEKMAADGVDVFIETGPGKTLSGLVKKTLRGVRIYHVEDEGTLKTLLTDI